MNGQRQLKRVLQPALPQADGLQEALPTGADNDDRLEAIVVALQQLQAGQQEIRSQLAGHAKSHLTVEEVADLVARSAYTIRSWIKQRRLRAVRVTGSGPRGRLLIPREELQRLIETGKGAQIPAVAGTGKP